MSKDYVEINEEVTIEEKEGFVKKAINKIRDNGKTIVSTVVGIFVGIVTGYVIATNSNDDEELLIEEAPVESADE